MIKKHEKYPMGQRVTVKPAVAATSIKPDPPLSGHFRAPQTILNASAPLLSASKH